MKTPFIYIRIPQVTPNPYIFAANFTDGTSSSLGRISGTGPTGVIPNGLIWL